MLSTREKKEHNKRKNRRGKGDFALPQRVEPRRPAQLPCVRQLSAEVLPCGRLLILKWQVRLISRNSSQWNKGWLKFLLIILKWLYTGIVFKVIYRIASNTSTKLNLICLYGEWKLFRHSLKVATLGGEPTFFSITFFDSFTSDVNNQLERWNREGQCRAQSAGTTFLYLNRP